ncbi:hypothetical protein TRFO_34344 [Tritrichomonas foetus]|uniref:Uncharacterized protein n=1 Tax=Tritrichomonas foetus TaxID=1144522 RepID=A0A1J4JJ82_9EUKA|nr:hypothetical protein TRFO_34344 [Tritrichomonas foetus]|eukprot:OHS99210.1 hypothetical protein TRFO_34344 [Tritrichomonas foetus]
MIFHNFSGKPSPSPISQDGSINGIPGMSSIHQIPLNSIGQSNFPHYDSNSLFLPTPIIQGYQPSQGQPRVSQAAAQAKESPPLNGNQFDHQQNLQNYSPNYSHAYLQDNSTTKSIKNNNKVGHQPNTHLNNFSGYLADLPNVELQQQQTLSSTTFPALEISLPSYDYQTSKTVFIPFDGRLCDNGRFLSLDLAMQFIAQHCLQNHGVFNRNLAKTYLKIAQIYNPMLGAYSIGSAISKHDFDSAFRRVNI